MDKKTDNDAEQDEEELTVDPYYGEPFDPTGDRLNALLPIIMVLVLILAGAGVYLLIRYQNAGTETAIAEDKLPTVTPHYDRFKLKEGFLEANGGLQSLEALFSMRAEGIIEKEGNQQKVVIIRHLPDFGRIVFRVSEDSTVVVVVNPEKVWMHVTSGETTDYVGIVSDEQEQVFRKMTHFFDPLMRFMLLDEGRFLELENEVNFRDRLAVRLRLAHADSPYPSDFFIEPGTFRTIGRVDLNAQLEPVKEDVFFDHRRVNGLQQPFRITSTSNGKLISKLILSSIEFNLPILRSSFEMPDSDLPQ